MSPALDGGPKEQKGERERETERCYEKQNTSAWTQKKINTNDKRGLIRKCDWAFFLRFSIKKMHSRVSGSQGQWKVERGEVLLGKGKVE